VDRRWRNVPIPEPHIGGLVAGIAANFFVPWHLFPSSWIGHVVGWPLVLAGLALAAWAVTAARMVDIEHPDSIITGGPYAYTRNPMYVGWTAIYLGVTFAVNTSWPLVFLPIVLALIHLEVLREERRLGELFGPTYIEYRHRTRRYL
jgi:protein-S-isoprenylcysteine O-methyltransferase Ste14